MIAVILSALSSKLAGFVGAGVAVIACLGLLVEAGQVAGVHGELKHAQALQLDTDRRLWAAEGNVTALGAALDQQSQEIAAWKADSDAHLARAAAAANASAKAAAVAQREHDQITAHASAAPDICSRLLGNYETFREAIK